MAAEEKDEKEKELEIVGEGAEPEEESSKDDDEGKEKAKAKEADKEDKSEDDEESDEDDEQEAGHSADDEDDQPKSKSRQRRDRNRESRARDKREIEFLTIRNQQLEQRFGAMEERQAQNERVEIDRRIETLKGQIEMADEVIAAAIEQGKGKDEREASKLRERLKDSLTRLETAKASIEEEEAESEEQAPRQAKGPPVEVQVLARVWYKENSWFKGPKATDKDSQRVVRIDNQLIKEGFDPADQEYWDELTRRAEKALPHRFEDRKAGHEEDDDEEPTRKTLAKKNGGGPKFRTGGRERSLGSNQVHISAARKAAMVEAGVWEDPVLRQRYLKSYQKYDTNKSSSA